MVLNGQQIIDLQVYLRFLLAVINFPHILINTSWQVSGNPALPTVLEYYSRNASGPAVPRE